MQLIKGKFKMRLTDSEHLNLYKGHELIGYFRYVDELERVCFFPMKIAYTAEAIRVINYIHRHYKSVSKRLTGRKVLCWF